MPRVALYAGSFDPVTNGHVDVIRQAARLADRLVIAVGIHPGKAPLFPFEERLAMLADVCAPIAKAAGCEMTTVTFEDLVVALARRQGAGHPDRVPAGFAFGPPDHRHTGPADRRHGGRL